MAKFLFVLCGCAFLLSLGIWAIAQSAIHEIEAGVFLLISAVLFSAGGIVSSVDSLKEDILRALNG